MKNKNHGGNLNMDDIMKMKEQLQPFQERQIPEEGQSHMIKYVMGLRKKQEIQMIVQNF